MFAFFGEFCISKTKLFEKLSQRFLNTESNPIISKTQHENAEIHLGQSPGFWFFPHNQGFENNPNKRFYGLQGYVWQNHKFPENRDQSKAMIKNYGDELIEKHATVLRRDCGGIYVLLAIELLRKTIFISCDHSGLIPLYYYMNNQGSLLFSTHLLPLAKTISAEIDKSGLIHSFAFHHAIGKRTVYKNIFRLNPGETICYNVETNSLSSSQISGFYSTIEHFRSDNEAADALWADYIEGLKPFSNLPGKRGVLLSGGFDTRLVVAGFSNENSPITSITFGDPDNNEVQIASSIAKTAKASNHSYPLIEDHNFSIEKINHLINAAESVNFPYCDTAVDHLLKDGGNTASTGYGGESYLGGQAYALMGRDWTQKTRLNLAIKRSLGIPVRFNEIYSENKLDKVLRTLIGYYEHILLRNKKIFSAELQLSFNEALTNLKTDLAFELNRILTSSPETCQQIYERFWIEHHVLKQFGRQEITLLAKLPVILPTVFPSFVQRCSNLDPTRKVDHGIYIKLVKRHFGELSNFPTANIPINLNYPEILLWASRAIRAKLDQNTMKKVLASKGNITPNRNGWSNFEVWLRQSNFFDNCLDFISAELFSYEFLAPWISGIKHWEKRIYSAQEFLTMITLSQLTK